MLPRFRGQQDFANGRKLSLGVVASAATVAAGLQIADPLIGLAITLVILRITRSSWQTVRQNSHPT